LRSGYHLSILGMFNLGSSFSVRSSCTLGAVSFSTLGSFEIGSSLTVRQNYCVSNAISILDGVSFGSAVSLRSMARLAGHAGKSTGVSLLHYM
jgi:hypothetical protein